MTQNVLAVPSPLLSVDEALRLEALDRLDILDTPRDPAFQQLASLTESVFDVPVAIISLMDAHRQWYKAHTGLANEEAARPDTFCKHVIVSGEHMVVEDAALDPRFRDNPFVTGTSGIRFYAGVPLRAREGEVVGTVCAIDYRPRKWTVRETQILSDIAAIAMTTMELSRHVATDDLTGCVARRVFMEESNRTFAAARRHSHSLSCVTFDLDHFKAVNDNHGHKAGELVLSGAANTVRSALRESDLFGRVGGEEFAILMPQTPLQGALDAAEKLRSALSSNPIDVGPRKLNVTGSFGVATLDRGVSDFAALLAAADTAMYVSKHEGRNRCMAAPQISDRRRVLKSGLIIFQNRSSTVDCTVRSLGEDGAGIDVSSTNGVPDGFALRIGPELIEKRCRVVARADRHLEVAFLP